MATIGKARYMLRRNLPLWKAEKTILETVAFCEDVGIGEIIWKVDAEEFNHGFTPHELIREYLIVLEKARELQSERGLIFSINPWLTLNHIGRNRYSDGPPSGFRWRVKPDGKEALEMACPLSPGWREWILEAYRLYATVKPDKLWLEDDFKTFAHTCHDLGCYCDEHLRAFSNMLGEDINREVLIERMITPGKPDPVRARWLDFQGSIMVEVCRELERVVHRESPGTRLGLMNSWSSDGRWWEDATMALAGPHRPLSRPSLAAYEEGHATEFLPDAFDMLKELACQPPNTECCPELENSLYTPYSKSARMTRLQLFIPQLLGHPAITMNLFDMLGSDTSEDPRFGRMLKDVKPMLDAIAEVAGSEGTSRGVSVPFHKRYADFAHAKEGHGYDVFRFDGDGWCHPLQGSGTPVFLNGEAMVYATTGQAVRAMGHKEIEKMLRRGLLLDGSAARVLQEVGYGAMIGVKVGERTERSEVLLSAERDDWAPESAEDNPVYMSLRHIAEPGDGRLYPLAPLSGAEAVSLFVGLDYRRVMPGMVTFENELGGRVAVYPFDLSVRPAAGFMSWRRRRQMQRIIRWLGRGEVDLFADGGAWMMPVRRDYPDYTFIAVLNFETDDWTELSVMFSHDGDVDQLRFMRLGHDGALDHVHPVLLERDGPNVHARFELSVPALDAAALCVTCR